MLSGQLGGLFERGKMKGERRGVMIGTVCHFALFQLKELIVVEHGEKRIGKERKGKTTFAHVSVSERNDTPEVPEQSRVSATAVKPLSTTLPPRVYGTACVSYFRVCSLSLISLVHHLITWTTFPSLGRHFSYTA